MHQAEEMSRVSSWILHITICRSSVKSPCPREDFRHSQWSEVLSLSSQPPSPSLPVFLQHFHPLHLFSLHSLWSHKVHRFRSEGADSLPLAAIKVQQIKASKDNHPSGKVKVGKASFGLFIGKVVLAMRGNRIVQFKCFDPRVSIRHALNPTFLQLPQTQWTIHLNVIMVRSSELLIPVSYGLYALAGVLEDVYSLPMGPRWLLLLFLQATC